MILIDYKDTRPIYEQIVDKLKILILSGAMEPESKLPSVRQMAVELSLNPNTVQRAYAELERTGFIYTIKGRGNFVCENHRLLDEKRTELKNKCRDLLVEAQAVGISRKEMIQFMEEIEDDRD